MNEGYDYLVVLMIWLGAFLFADMWVMAMLIAVEWRRQGKAYEWHFFLRDTAINLLGVFSMVLLLKEDALHRPLLVMAVITAFMKANMAYGFLSRAAADSRPTRGEEHGQ